jgi:hypothetical protein
MARETFLGQILCTSAGECGLRTVSEVVSRSLEELMEIHLVSSLTSDDESRLAPGILAAIGRVLDRLPVSYSLRIETTAGNAIQHHHTTIGQTPGDPAADPLAEAVYRK